MANALPYKGKDEQPKTRNYYTSPNQAKNVTPKETASGRVAGWAKAKISESIENAKQERAYNKSVKQAAKQNYDKGYIESSYERGKKEGAMAGNRNGSYKMSGGRSPSSNDMFGAGIIGGGIGFGGGFDMFGGGAPTQRPAPPMKTTVISKSGRITVQEPVMPQHKKQESGDIFGGGFWGSPVGAAGGNGKKGEKHPYDIF